MIECINQVLELIINMAVVFGIGVLAYLYFKIRMIDSEVEEIEIEFEKRRDLAQGRHVPMGAINGEIANLRRKKDERLAPLIRARQRIVSKIPFIK